MLSIWTGVLGFRQIAEVGSQVFQENEQHHCMWHEASQGRSESLEESQWTLLRRLDKHISQVGVLAWTSIHATGLHNIDWLGQGRGGPGRYNRCHDVGAHVLRHSHIDEHSLALLIERDLPYGHEHATQGGHRGAVEQTPPALLAGDADEPIDGMFVAKQELFGEVLYVI